MSANPVVPIGELHSFAISMPTFWPNGNNNLKWSQLVHTIWKDREKIKHEIDLVVLKILNIWHGVKYSMIMAWLWKQITINASRFNAARILWSFIGLWRRIEFMNSLLAWMLNWCCQSPANWSGRAACLEWNNSYCRWWRGTKCHTQCFLVVLNI